MKIFQEHQASRHLVGFAHLASEVGLFRNTAAAWRAVIRQCPCDPFGDTGPAKDLGVSCEARKLKAASFKKECVSMRGKTRQVSLWYLTPPQPQPRRRANEAERKAEKEKEEAASAHAKRVAEFEQEIKNEERSADNFMDRHGRYFLRCTSAINLLGKAGKQTGPGAAAKWAECWQCAEAFDLFFKPPFQSHQVATAAAVMGFFPPCVELEPQNKNQMQDARPAFWDGITDGDRDRATGDSRYVWMEDAEKRVGVRYPHDAAHLRWMRIQMQAWVAQAQTPEHYGDTIQLFAPTTTDPHWYMWLDTDDAEAEDEKKRNGLAAMLASASKAKAEPPTLARIKHALIGCTFSVATSIQLFQIPSRTCMNWATAHLKPRWCIDGHYQAGPAGCGGAATFWNTMRMVFRDCVKLWTSVHCRDTQAHDLAMLVELIADQKLVDTAHVNVISEMRLFASLLDSFMCERTPKISHRVWFDNGNRLVFSGTPEDAVLNLPTTRFDMHLYQLSLDLDPGSSPCTHWPDIVFTGDSGAEAVHGVGPGRTYVAALGAHLIRELFPEIEYEVGPYKARARMLGQISPDSIHLSALGVLLHAASGMDAQFEELRHLARAYWPALDLAAAEAQEAQEAKKAKKAKDAKEAKAKETDLFTLADVFPLLMTLRARSDGRHVPLLRNMLDEIRRAKSANVQRIASAREVYSVAHAANGVWAEPIVRTLGPLLFAQCSRTRFGNANQMRDTLVGERASCEWTGADVVKWVRVEHRTKEAKEAVDAKDTERKRAHQADMATVTRLLTEHIASLDSKGCESFIGALCGAVVAGKISINVFWHDLGGSSGTNIYTCFRAGDIHLAVYQRSGITDLKDIVRSAMADFCTATIAGREVHLPRDL